MKTHLEEQQAEPESEGKPARSRRNGHSKKTIKGEFWEAQFAKLVRLLRNITSFLQISE
jgi:putative transposase